VMPALHETPTAPSPPLSARVGQPSGQDEQPTRTSETPREGATQPLQRTVLFDAGEAFLKPDGGRQLREVVQVLHAQPTWRVQIAGYVDAEEVSSSKETWELARRREEAVRTYLRQGGVPQEHILPAPAHDASHPVAPTDTPEGRAQNRRVVISLHPSP